MTNHDALIFWMSIAWLCVSFHGVVLTFTRLRDALDDRRWLHDQNINGPRTIMADGGIRAAATRLWLFLTFFLFGVNAIIGETVPNVPIREVIVTALLVLVLVGQAVAAQLDARDSSRLMTMLQIARATHPPESDPFHGGTAT